MSVTIHCPHCGATGNAPDHILGQSVRCSKCKQSFVAGGEERHEDSDMPEESAEEQFGDIDDMPAPPKRSGGKSRPARSGGGGGFGDVLMFRTMVAPWIILVVFWLGIVGVVLGALGTIIMSFFSGSALTIIMALFGGLLFLIFGCIWVRLVAELMMVQFRIYECLKEMKNKPPTP